MSSPDGRFHIVFNGEIYNFAELRQELKAAWSFRSTCDTEVLLAAWATWGPACLERLVGMFAFAVLDCRGRTVTLVRDFFGIKPLYYALQGGKLVFASEIKAILAAVPELPKRANPQALYEYLRFGLSDSGAHTMFEGVHQVPPAHLLMIPLNTYGPRSNGLVASANQFEGVDSHWFTKVTSPRNSFSEVTSPSGSSTDFNSPGLHRYWTLRDDERSELSFDDASAHLREMFLESVNLHLRSDVEVGVALSGGLDSSAIAMAIRHHRPCGSLHTFSYLPSDPALSEERYIDEVAAACGAMVHKTQPHPAELLEDLDALIATQDEPFGTTSIWAQLRVFRLARSSGIKVTLDGQGADELLAGYVPMLAGRLATMIGSGKLVQAGRLFHAMGTMPGVPRSRLLGRAIGLLVPASLQRLPRRLAGEGLFPQWLDRQWFEARGVNAKPIWTKPRRCGAGDDAREFLREGLYQAIESNSLPMLLRYQDRNSMAHGLESRVPFLTPGIARFVLSLPESYILGGDGTSKNVFRAAMAGLVPASVLARRDKIGFATARNDFASLLAPWCDRVLSDTNLAAIPVLNAQEVGRSWQAVKGGSRPFDWSMWRWINLAAWAQRMDVQF